MSAAPAAAPVAQSGTIRPYGPEGWSRSDALVAPGGWSRSDGLVAPGEWSRSDGLVTVGAAGADMLGYLLAGQDQGVATTVPGALLPVLAALPLLVRHRWPVPVLAAVLLCGWASELGDVTPLGLHAALSVALYSVAKGSRPTTVAVTTLVTVAAQVLRSSSAAPRLAVAGAATALLVVAFGVTVRQWQQQVETNRRLQADRAVAEERRRIARELHDIVAHHITTMYLMSGGARANLRSDPDVAHDALVDLESSGRMALREMRQLLGVLRGTDEPDGTPAAPQPGVADLDRLAAEACAAGLPTELTVHGVPRELPPAVALTVYRIVQEALTNSRRHAGRAVARVRLDYGADEVSVEVCDDGRGAPVGASGGFGLLGMRERVALHGGALEAGNRREGGFRVAARLPAHRAHHENRPTKEERAET
ncbi:sensor histidine kinase [Streptomyces sp. NPDC004788]